MFLFVHFGTAFRASHRKPEIHSYNFFVTKGLRRESLSRCQFLGHHSLREFAKSWRLKKWRCRRLG